MHDYLKPTKRDFDRNIFILHAGTNNLSTNNSPEMIANKIVGTAESLKVENNNFILPAIVPRVDKMNTKNTSNVNNKRHLNRSKLHLNGYGKSIFIRNVRNYLTNFK